MKALAPCPSCTRHVRVSETLCPFCASALPVDMATRARPRVVARLARAGIFAVGTTLAAATTAACSSVAPSTDAGGMPDTSVRDTGPGGIDAAYGGPPDLGPVDMGPGGIDAAYGGPPDMGAPDAGPATPDAATQDAGADDLGGIHTLYGVPPTPA